MKKTSVHKSVLILFLMTSTTVNGGADVRWKHLSSAGGDIEPPSAGKQQTATAVFDVDADGDNDFMITECSESPSVVLYRRGQNNWKKYIVDNEHLRIEAGSAVYDIDGDSDLDIVFCGDSGSNAVWWWENPYPDFNPVISWKRHDIKNTGKNKHHDQMFGDFDNDGKIEFVFWNQGMSNLCIAEIPGDPKNSGPWNSTVIYSWSSDSQMKQRGSYPGWKSVNEHEGLVSADIDGDGTLDIVGGGRWLKYPGDGKFMPNIIDAGYSFSRSVAGQLVEGGRPEVVLVVGDGIGPIIMYEWIEGTWHPTVLVKEIKNGHSLDIIDFNGDGHLDIFNAEMKLDDNPHAKARILLGDGKGNFETVTLTEGFDNHESRIVDLDGDGDYDILGKPYNWEAPRLDIWINEGK